MWLKRKYDSLSLTAKSTIWFMICNCVLSGINFISMPFFTRLMSTEQFGYVTVYNSWLNLITVFATLNLSSGAFNNGMVRWPEKRNRFSSSMQGLITVTSSCCFLIVCLLYIFHINILDLSFSMICAMFIQILMTGIFMLYSARQRYEYKYIELVKVTFCYAIALTLFSIVCVGLDPVDDTKAAVKVWSAAIGTCLIGIYLIIKTQKKEHVFYDNSFWHFAFFFSLPLIPHYLAMSVLGQIDRIMIARFINEQTAAIYSVAYTVGMAIQVVASALNSATVPWQFEKLKRNDYAGLSSRLNSLVFLLSVVSILVVLVSPEIMAIAAPESYYEAVNVMPCVSTGVVYMFIYNILSNYEFYFSANKFIAVASVSAAICKFLLNSVLIPQFGYMAAAYSTVACYAILAAAHTIFSKYVCGKFISPNNANKTFNALTIWCIAIIGMVLCFIISLTYPYFILRLCIFVLFAIILVVKRKSIISLFKKKE